MTTSNPRIGGWLMAALVAAALTWIVLLAARAAPAAALRAEPTARGTGPGRFDRLQPAAILAGKIGAGPAAADFAFDKRVMLTVDYQRTQSCAGSVDALTVNYGASVTYCYLFTNIGATTFLTHTFTDDRLGGWGPQVMPVGPGGQTGFIGYDPAEAVTGTVTNIATWTATDAAGVAVSRTDTVTVQALPYLRGHVYLDANDNGVRDPEEQGGLAQATILLEQAGQVVRQGKTAAPAGRYEIFDIAPGTYAVVAQIPAGHIPTTPVAVEVTLAAGEAPLVDFGVRPASTGTPPAVRYEVWLPVVVQPPND